jgi:DNA-binding GntR family transcriptional regulator
LPCQELTRLQRLAEPAVDFDDPESLRRFLATNRTIHLAIAEAAGNRRTARILDRLLDDSERARLVALRAGAGGRGVRAREELQLVLGDLEKEDGPQAARLMAEAIRTFRDELVEALQRAALDVPLSGLTPASA